MRKRYIVVSPMKNEETYVGRTLESMLSQNIHPQEWVIMNDGSSDRSPDIVLECARKAPWVRLLNSSGLGDRRAEHYGGHVVDLVMEGLRSIESPNYDFIVKLDCDVSFAGTFFERIFDEFERNPRLGISSGISFLDSNGTLVEEKSAPTHTLGATKVYRRECFAEIGGLVPSMGWDGIDEIKARMLGWQAWPIRELKVLHHRPEGAATGFLSSGVERGKGSYFMGYHPVFLATRAIGRMLRGFVPDGLGMLTGYFRCWAKSESRVDDPEFITFLRKQQVRKLLFLRSEI